jgi:hypothetical protein
MKYVQQNLTPAPLLTKERGGVAGVRFFMLGGEICFIGTALSTTNDAQKNF